jgi:hypothetical protein
MRLYAIGGAAIVAVLGVMFLLPANNGYTQRACNITVEVKGTWTEGLLGQQLDNLVITSTNDFCYNSVVLGVFPIFGQTILPQTIHGNVTLDTPKPAVAAADFTEGALSLGGSFDIHVAFSNVPIGTYDAKYCSPLPIGFLGTNCQTATIQVSG